MPDRLTGRTLVIATGHDLSLALLEEGRVLAGGTQPMLRGHAEALIPAIAELLRPFGGPRTGCRRIVVETGPGSFTGLRVGFAAARALALAWEAELVGVRSTQLVAADARAAGAEGALLVALQAPRGQVWLEGFAADGGTSLAPCAVAPAEAAGLAARFATVAGTVAALLGGRPPCAPSAAAVAGLAPAALGAAELLYVRTAESGDVDNRG